jgi:hypothetical protein
MHMPTEILNPRKMLGLGSKVFQKPITLIFRLFEIKMTYFLFPGTFRRVIVKNELPI